ncbi:major histocompatibility complex class I-related gene protein-like isoform X2 [Carassius auratus]|uniref:Major histocompatibility complex class I-related gene protein-like isoform X2 n=1 Tax=Carassius auratus TaxID=7957 RepID=A0A6P6NR93_CARAU|nr:major histocompatibility complex class I-related gene protein-like isoform X2 [Carassius auratus]
MFVLFVFLFPCLKVVSAAGQTPFPEFSAVLMLDDVQIAYYDSKTWKLVYRSHNESKYYDEEKSNAEYVFRVQYNELKYLEFHYNDHFNHSGVHVTQRLAGCELLNNDKPGPLYYWDAFDGQNVGELTFDIEKKEIQNKLLWKTWDQAAQFRIKFLHQNVYHPICIKTLRRYLNMEKNNVMRKVKPRVRLMKKMLPDSQGLQISCLATGFYPRHINLTLFRDGQPVDDDQITGGEILPNGDGTYQMRKSLVISKEKLRQEHKYNCTMQRLNLDNKLDITSDVDESDPGSFSLPVVISVLLLLVFMCGAGFVKKRRAAGRGSETTQSDYSLASSSACHGDKPRDSLYWPAEGSISGILTLMHSLSTTLPIYPVHWTLITTQVQLFCTAI